MWFLKDTPPSLPGILETDTERTLHDSRRTNLFPPRLERAEGYAEIWKIVKETVKNVLGKSRVSMMLFLDDLPLNIGAYHSVGTNNIVLNRALVEIAEETAKSKLEVNAFAYTLLAHEYLHALGYLSEDDVKYLV